MLSQQRCRANAQHKGLASHLTTANAEVREELRHQPHTPADDPKASMQVADLSYKTAIGHEKLVAEKIKKYSIKGRAEGRNMLCCSTGVGVVPLTPLEA